MNAETPVSCTCPGFVRPGNHQAGCPYAERDGECQRCDGSGCDNCSARHVPQSMNADGETGRLEVALRDLELADANSSNDPRRYYVREFYGEPDEHGERDYRDVPNPLYPQAEAELTDAKRAILKKLLETERSQLTSAQEALRVTRACLEHISDYYGRISAREYDDKYGKDDVLNKATLEDMPDEVAKIANAALAQSILKDAGGGTE